jgi:hypothetical protein
MPPTRPRKLSIKERADALRLDAEAFIDAHVSAEKEQCPTIPAEALKQMLFARLGHCPVRAAIRLEDEQRDVE